MYHVVNARDQGVPGEVLQQDQVLLHLHGEVFHLIFILLMGNEIWAPFTWSRVRIQQWVLKIRILWPTLLDFSIYCPNSYLNYFIFSGSSDVMVLTAIAAACHLLQHLDPHSALGPASRLCLHLIL